jgi:hypothetical protein
MDYAKEAANFEREVSKECAILVRKDAEEWEAKNKAISQLTRMVRKYENMELERIQEIFGMNIFRVLKEPIKQMMSDLRSQQVRDTCTFLSTMSMVLGDHMRHFLRDTFPSVLDGVKQTNKVMGSYVDECIVTMIRYTTFKTSIPFIIEQIQSSKSKQYRERCVDYINEIIVSWDITDKDAEMLCEAIKVGLEDASVRCREISRLAYLNMFQMFPHKTDAMKAELSKAVQKRLNKEEEQFLISEEYQSGQNQLDAAAAAAAEQTEDSVDASVNQSGLCDQFERSAVLSPGAVASTDVNNDDGLADLTAPPIISRTNTNNSESGRSPVSLRTRRQSVEEGSVTSIQAVIRGALSRRHSSLRADDHVEEGLVRSPAAAVAVTASASPQQAGTRTPGTAERKSSSGGSHHHHHSGDNYNPQYPHSGGVGGSHVKQQQQPHSHSKAAQSPTALRSSRGALSSLKEPPAAPPASTPGKQRVSPPSSGSHHNHPRHQQHHRSTPPGSAAGRNSHHHSTARTEEKEKHRGHHYSSSSSSSSSSIYSSTGKFKGSGGGGGGGLATTTAAATKTTEKRKRLAAAAAVPAPALQPLGPLGDARKAEAVGLLKLKVNFMMQLLEKDISLIKQLEDGGGGEDGSVAVAAAAEFDENSVNSLIELSAEQVCLCRNYEDRLNSMLLSAAL